MPAIPRPMLIMLGLVVAAIVIIALVVVAFPQGPDTNTQPCPNGECSPGAPPPVHFAVSVSVSGCQPWFQAAQPQINSWTAYDTLNPPGASLFHSWDLIGTTMNIWVTYSITYQSGKTYGWTSTQYAVNSGNGACSNAVNIIGYFTGEPGNYVITVTAYAQAINCWPNACSVQSTVSGPKQFSL